MNSESVVFLDIRKAFDTVNHEILLDKLNCYGIQDEELLLFGSYSRDCTQCCSVNGYKSTLKEGNMRGASGFHPWIITFHDLFE